MNDLRGMISICNLCRVRSKEEAVQAMLSSKPYLRKLEMTWNGRFYDEGEILELEEEILEALVPPLDLMELSIQFYGGLNFPSWMEQPCMSNLESLCLRGCRNLNSLPQLWHLEFLKTMELVRCRQLKNLSPISTTLRELTLDDVGLEVLPEFCWPSDCPSSSSATPSLSILKIKRCSALKSLQRGLLRCHLRHLTVLSIQDCPELSEWPEGEEFRATLLSLQKELYLKDCPTLRTFPVGSTFSASLEKLSITGCPNIVDGPLFARLHDLSSECIVCVSNRYANLQHCFPEALRHIRTVNSLVIDEDKVRECDFYHGEQDDHLPLVCDMERLGSWRCHKRIVTWRVQIRVKRNRTERSGVVDEAALPRHLVLPEEWWGTLPPPEMPIPVKSDDPDTPVSSSFPRSQEPNATLVGAPLPFNMQTSVKVMCISHCRGTRPLLANALLTHLTGLKELHLFDCPNLTFSSLRTLIPSLASLHRLTIKACPTLSSSYNFCSFSLSPSVLPEPSLLQTLFVDDDVLIGDAGFVRDYLGSLRGLHIWHGDRLTTLTAGAEEGLRSLGQSLCHLSFKSCGNLEQLPSNLRSLLPSLKALSIGDCPKLRRLSAGGLPACLEILVVHDCCLLEGRCTPPLPLPPAGENRQRRRRRRRRTDWHKISHVRVIVNHGDLVQGSYREFSELKAKWRDF